MLVRVSARFELPRVRVIGIRLFILIIVVRDFVKEKRACKVTPTMATFLAKLTGHD